LQGAAILATPTEVLGGFVTPIQGRQQTAFEEFTELYKKLADFERKTKRILQTAHLKEFVQILDLQGTNVFPSQIQ
jgi:hypothetical protein